MDDLNKGNIDPTVDANPNITGLYSKCYAGLIMEGNDGNADFSIDDAGKSCLLRVMIIPIREGTSSATASIRIGIRHFTTHLPNFIKQGSFRCRFFLNWYCMQGIQS